MAFAHVASHTNQFRSMSHNNWDDLLLSVGTPTTTPLCWPVECHTCADSSSPSGIVEVNVPIVTLHSLVHENGGYWYVLADKGVFWRASAGFDGQWRIWAESTQ